MLPIGEEAARDQCCHACILLDECTGFSFETTRTTIRATNRTARATYSCVYMRRHEELSSMSHKRELYEAVGHARATRTESACYVAPPYPPPSPPSLHSPPNSPTLAPVEIVPPLSNEEIRLVVEDYNVRRGPMEGSPMGDEQVEQDWWWQLPDLENDHRSPWMNRTPVPKVRWKPTSDAFERL